MDDPVPREGASKRTDEHPEEEVLVLHPVIRALGWLKDWTRTAILLAVLWEYLAAGRLSVSSPGPIAARAGAVSAALLLSAILGTLVVETWWNLVSHTRRQYEPPFSTYMVLVLTLIALAISFLFAMLAKWIFGWLWPLLWKLGERVPKLEPGLGVSSMPIWLALPLLAVGSAVAFVMLWPVAPKHLRIWRLLGARRSLRGYAVMLLLRLRQPRKDFFLQAPLVGQLPAFTLAAVLHQIAPFGFLSWALPGLLVSVYVGYGLDMLLPPAWLFLGRSHFDSFRTFDYLRGCWPPFGVTLLNRDSKQWHDYYFAAASELARRGFYGARFMNKPRTPRAWSLRTRQIYWEHTVWLLMDLVQVVVLDARQESRFVFDEVLWLVQNEWIEKALILGEPDGGALALDGALAWAKEDEVVIEPGAAKRLAARVVTEDTLYNASWNESGLQILA